MTHEEAWMFCRLRAKYRTEHRARVREDVKGAAAVLCGFAWFFGLLALAGLM